MSVLKAIRDRYRRTPLRSNAIANLIGTMAPLLIALITIPILVRTLGEYRFGILALAWVFLGYFSVFDLGMGSALTRAIAAKLASRELSAIPTIIFTGNAAILCLGLVATVFMYVAGPFIATRFLNVPIPSQLEVIECLNWIAVGLPFVCSAGGLRGTLEAYQRFDVVNAIRIPTSALNFVAPLLVLPLTDSLSAIVFALVVSRILIWIAFLAAVRCVVRTKLLKSFSTSVLIALLSYGGWMTISNVVGPLMVYMDRVLIGSLTSVSAVTYYVAAFEVVTKALLPPGAIAGVTFPAFVNSIKSPNSGSTMSLMLKGQSAIFLLIFPVVFILAAFAHEVLRLWINTAIADHSARVLQILAIGVLFNGTAFLKSALIQAAGRPDITAKLHIVELPIYGALLWYGTSLYGIEGAAMAWTVRAVVDHLVLTILVPRTVPEARNPATLSAAWAIAGSLALLLCLLESTGALFFAVACFAATSVAVLKRSGFLSENLVRRLWGAENVK